MPDTYSVTVNETKDQYRFVTSMGYQYSVYFLLAKDDYFSDFPEIPNNIYLFGFSLLNSTSGNLPFDEKVAQTICSILLDFFQSKENIIIFICDSVDKKERQRSITFNKWFHKYQAEYSFEKVDKVLEYDESNRYYLSLIFRYDNPDKNIYLDAFSQMTNGLEK